MSFELSLLNNSALMTRQAVEELLALNAKTPEYGLSLTPAQAQALAQVRLEALRQNGRIEFGGGATAGLILAFRDSPYIYPQNYEETISDLTEVFYAYKNETNDLMRDDELIAYMKAAFDGVCQGSVELLASRELYRLANKLRARRAPEQEEDGDD